MLILMASCAEAKLITEVNYNPDGEDNNLEYIEIALSNLTGYSISDLESSDNLTLLNYFEGNYSLIVEEDFNYSGINASIYSAGKTIGNNLNNNFDVIFLKKNGSVEDVAYYTSEFGGNGNNKSLCWKENIFVECLRSPGVSEIIENITVRINEIMPDPEGDDSVNEWIELYNYGDKSFDLDGVALIDESGKKLFISDATTNETIISPNNYLIVRTNNFSGLLNNEGFEKISLDGIDEFSYGGSKEGLSWAKFEEGWEKSVPTLGKVNEKKSFDTRLKLEKVEDEAEFGELIVLRLDVLRGDTTKKAIKVYLKGNGTASEITSLSLDNRFVMNEFTLPLQIKDNCDNKLKEGKYELIIDGLNEQIREPITLNKNKNCPKEKLTTTNSSKSVKLESNQAEKHLNTITGNVVYEANDVVAERYGIYFFCISLIMLLIYFAWTS